MRKLMWLPFGATLAIALPAAAQHRELGAHEHGRGTLNIAVEGNRIAMELEVPGADIVGFEHAAKTDPQREAVEKAKAQLRTAQSLFRFPASAGCVLADAKVAVEAEDHDDDHPKQEGATPGKQSGAKEEPAGHHEQDERGHSQFHVQYAFDCKAPASITAIEFGYFRAFANAQKLDVNLITAKGQTRFEVTRARPRIDLAGQM